ncbi:hypothetical protein GGS21DRAFT_546840 [Xylaria nigripes]|nr:hypothetical protein GGS21DRAFT_546840 [Xylaria nigripes]
MDTFRSANQSQVTVENSSTSRVPLGRYTLSDLLQSEGDAERFVILLGDRRYVLFLAPMSVSLTEWDPTDAAAFCHQSMMKSAPYGTCLFSLGEKLGEVPSSQCMVLSLMQTESPGFESITGIQVPGLKRRSRAIDRWFSGLHTRTPIRRIAVLSLLLIVVILAVASFVIKHEPNNQIWQRYNTAGSQGPLYQLQFDHHNVSDWETRYPDTNQEWFLRIDDQAMIPLHLVDDEELRYQRWFQQRYTEADRIRLEGKYLTESFLSDPSTIQVPADKTYHMARCVVALRRYWIARESKSHVCPRDIDYKHMKHCLDALDMWAFPEGPRQSLPMSSSMHHGSAAEDSNKVDDSGEYRVDSQDDTRLVWRTKVCFRGF